MYLLFKALLSGALIALISEVSKRSPAFGALIASLPLVSYMGMMWLWRDTHDTQRLATHAQATFWYVLPSLPAFLLLPVLLQSGVPFWVALAASATLTIALYFLMVIVLRSFGISL